MPSKLKDICNFTVTSTICFGRELLCLYVRLRGLDLSQKEEFLQFKCLSTVNQIGEIEIGNVITNNDIRIDL